jgi:hypothetical protein
VKRRVLWHDRRALGAEHCTLSAEPGGFRFDAVLATAIDGAPLLVEYIVRVDSGWRTRRAEVKLNGGGGKDTLILLADGYGGWWCDAHRVDELEGCLDVDLSITPSTNTLPIRRLLLQPGQSASIDAARVAFPVLAVARAAQTYERVDAHGYIFKANKQESDLEVDNDGLVTRRGSWTAIAAE